MPAWPEFDRGGVPGLRILITSDLHFEATGPEAIRRFVAGIDREAPDLVVVGGDLGYPLHLYEQCLALFLVLDCPVAVLPGNQDIWTSPGTSSIALLEEQLPAIVRELDFHWLENDPLVLPGGIAICGSLGWYDYSARVADDGDLQRIVARKDGFCLDAEYIDWEYTDPQFSDICRERLLRQMRALEDNPRVSCVACVTHVPVFADQYEPNPEDERWCRSLPYLANLTLGEALRTFPKLRYLISGHMHSGLQGVVERDGLDPIATAVVGSGYGRPRWLVLEL